MLLEIKKLHAQCSSKIILKGIDLRIKSGTVHVIMGQNGAGKSTLANALIGKKECKIIHGDILLKKKSILNLDVSERAQLGLFLSLQNPIEISGVSNVQFLKTALNSIRKARQENEIDVMQFMQQLKSNMNLLNIDHSYMHRGVNEGFSGGEKKRNEMLQIMMLEPKVCILDEIDSGLDIDAIQCVVKAILSMRNQERCFIIITHYQQFIKYLTPDFVHILMNGKIVRSGGKDLALKLDKEGYSFLN